MLLNLLRIEDADPERLMQLSFHQFQNERAVPAMQAELAELEARRGDAAVAGEADVAAYYGLCASMDAIREAMRGWVTRPEFALPFLQARRGGGGVIPSVPSVATRFYAPLLQAGRLVRVREADSPGVGPGEDWGWGVIVSFQKRAVVAAGGAVGGAPSAPGAFSDGAAAAAGGPADPKAPQVYVVDVLLPCQPVPPGGTPASRLAVKPRPAASGAGGGGAEWRVVPVLLPALASLSSIRMHMPKDLRSREARDGAGEQLLEIQVRHRRR